MSSPAATITFSGTVTGSTQAPYTEAGFTASVLSGAVFYNRGSIGKYVGGSETAGGGVLGITASNGSAFTYSGLDYSAFYDSLDYTGIPGTQTLTVQGYLNHLLVATETYTLTNTSSYTFTTQAAGSLSGLRLDQLTLNLQAGISSDYRTVFAENVTNVVVNPAAAPITVTPEPSSFVLLATGLAGLAGAVGRRSTHA